MSYQVIARQYRPQRFSDVVGQEHVTQTLSNAIASGRIAHAYLFCGPRGTGKTTIARIFAKCLNCTGGPKPEFPEDDPRCVEITEGRSLDVIEIDGASNRGIDEIRELRESVRYAPASSKFKIYIIDEVHMLTKEAFNALLKTLEEPPAHVKFMFATTEPEKVLPTILSRCQRFDLRRISNTLIVQHLAVIAKKEGIVVDADALLAIARGADGGMRDAQSILDQLISFCGDKIEEADVLAMFGLASRAQILGLIRALLERNAAGALHELAQLTHGGKELGRVLAELLNHLRNLLVVNVARGDWSLVEVTEAEKESLAPLTTLADAGALGRMLEVLVDCEMRLRDAASRRIFLEVALVKSIQAAGAVPLDLVLQKLQQLRTEAPEPTAASPRATTPVTPVDTAVLPATAIAKPISNTSPLEATWRSLLESVGRVSPFARSYLLEGHPVSCSNSVFTIGYDPEFSDHLSLVDNSKNHTIIQTKLAELGMPGMAVKFIQAERPTDWAAPRSAESPAATPGAAPAKKPAKEALTEKDFKNDPLIKKALEIFEGRIVDIRS
ncbi:MAG: DNA polymerase III subunit gamma/tau [Pedosphaera sp.]|nr:DNA polymerase III subunit gamma/tau [Pedosphaera sp.]